MRSHSVAKRYVKALLQIAREQGKVEEFADQLKGLVTGLAGDELLFYTMDSPVIKPSQKKAIFKVIVDRLQLEKEIFNLGRVLIDNKRFSLLPFLNLLYQEKTDELLGRIKLKIRVASNIDEAQEERLRRILEKALGKKVLLSTEVSPNLLGGLWIQVQDQVFDASLKRALERIRTEVVQKAVA